MLMRCQQPTVSNPLCLFTSSETIDTVSIVDLCACQCVGMLTGTHVRTLR